MKKPRNKPKPAKPAKDEAQAALDALEQIIGEPLSTSSHPQKPAPAKAHRQKR